MKKTYSTPQIFISYARENKKKAEELYQVFLKAGFRPWMDIKDLLPGEKWATSIQRAIRNSDFFLALFSKDSIGKRGFLQKEFRQALDIWQEMLEEDIYFIPVRLDECEIPDRFREFQWLDLITEDDLLKLTNTISVGFDARIGASKYSNESESVNTETSNYTDKTTKLVESPDQPKAIEKKHTSILFLAANPSDTSPLMLDEEISEIDRSLRVAEFRDNFSVQQHWAVRDTDLQEFLLRHNPDIVHFSGHGSSANEIILKDRYGHSQPVSAHALSQLFSILKGNIRCVVLNACYSSGQAKAIAEHVDCVVGMSKAVGDQAAISFASAFYRALGYGKDVKTAFDLGCVEINIENLDEQDTPKLYCVRDNPKDIVFVDRSL